MFYHVPLCIWCEAREVQAVPAYGDVSTDYCSVECRDEHWVAQDEACSAFADDGEPMGCQDFSDDAEALASAGWGMDEDYGYYGGDDF